MLKRDAAKRLLSHPQVRSTAADLALKLGSLAILRGANRLLPNTDASVKPAKKARLLTFAAPVAAALGAGALARVLYIQSKRRRKRMNGRGNS